MKKNMAAGWVGAMLAGFVGLALLSVTLSGCPKTDPAAGAKAAADARAGWEGVGGVLVIGCGTSRMRVPGGWLYRSMGSNGDVVALAFVPEPAGEKTPERRAGHE